MKPEGPIPVPNYGLYEVMKAQWCDQYPGATPAEYDTAVRRIAEECGV